MKIAGIVILYHPEATVIQYVQTYLTIVDVLYISDNSPEINPQLANALQQIPKVQYLHDGNNMGIAYRLNQAANLAIEAGYEWLLTMDQDSYFEPNVAEQYIHCVAGNIQKHTTAMFGITMLERPKQSIDCIPRQVTELITSGSLVNLPICIAIGGFDEQLFIDLVDHEYCYRCISKGYGIIQFDNIFLCHSIGVAIAARSVATGQRSTRSLHSPIRLYYMLRNYWYVHKKYPTGFDKELSQQKKSIQVRIKNYFLYGKQKTQLAGYLIRAYMDYRKGRMGKINSN